MVYIHALPPLTLSCYSRVGSCTIYQSLRGPVVCLVTMFLPTRAEHGLITWLYLRPFSGPLPTFFCYMPPSDCTLAFHWHTTRLSTTQFFSLLPNSSPFHPIALSVIPTNQIPPFPMTSQPLHPTWNALFIPQSASRWRSAHNSTLLSSTNIAQHYIPIVTEAPHFPILFSKNPIFKNFLGPFPGHKGLLPLTFEFPYSPYISQNFFLTFVHNSHFLLHGTAKRLNSTLIRPSCTTPRGAQPADPRHTWPAFFFPHPSKRWSLTSTVTPTPLLYSFFSFSPKSMSDHTEGHTTDTLGTKSCFFIARRGEWIYTPLILNMGTRWRWVVNFTSRPL